MTFHPSGQGKPFRLRECCHSQIVIVVVFIDWLPRDKRADLAGTIKTLLASPVLAIVLESLRCHIVSVKIHYTIRLGRQMLKVKASGAGGTTEHDIVGVVDELCRYGRDRVFAVVFLTILLLLLSSLALSEWDTR